MLLVGTLLFVITLFAQVTLIQAKQERRIDPSCSFQSDCVYQIQEAIDECDSDGCTIILNNGFFIIDAPAFSTVFKISKKTDLTFRGQGPEDTAITMSNIFTLFEVTNSVRITFSGFQVGMRRVPFTYGITVSPTSMTVDTKDFPYGSEQYPWLNTAQAINEYTPNVGFGTIDKYVLEGAPLVYQDRGKVLDFTHTGVTAPVGIGIIVRHQVYGHNVFSLSKTDTIRFDNILMFAAGGMGIFSSFCADISVENVRVENAEPDPMSLCADGFHFQNSRGYLRVFNCTLKGQGDDGINVVTSLMKITVISPNRTRMIVRGFTPEAPLALKAEDQIDFLDGETLRWKGLAEALKISGNTVFLGAELPGGIEPGDLVFDKSAVPDSVLIDNCRFSTNRARGIIAKGPNMMISNNLFERTSGPAILIQTDACSFMEGPTSSNVTIQYNRITFANSGPGRDSGVITVANLIQKFPVCTNELPNWSNTNVTIRGNLFTQKNKMPGIYIANTNFGSISENSFNQLGQQIETHDCWNMNFKGNLCLDENREYEPCDPKPFF